MTKRESQDGGGRRGRPPLNREPGSTLSAWLPVSVHDMAVRRAKQDRMSVSEFVREAVKKACAHFPTD
jgi:predicted HicB family RNase H-like nuclease